MIEYNAPFGLVKNPYGPRPTFPSNQFARPNWGSKSHRNMIEVAIVEATTGTKNAVRYRRMNQMLRLSATATPMAATMEIGTKSPV